MTSRIVVDLSRHVRRRLERWARKASDAQLRTRILIVLRYGEGWGAHRIAEALGCVPATAVRVVHRFLELGEEGLLDGRRDNGQPKVDADLQQALAEILNGSPQDHGWQRPTWTRELLVRTLENETRIQVSVTTLARMLARLQARWGMARPTVACPWPKAAKRRRLRAIAEVLDRLPPDEVVFYEDEMDVHLNPRIGRDWTHRAQQRVILTPGRNEKRYVAGALSADGKQLVFVAGEKKNTDLFIQLLARLLRSQPRARRIHVILDNFTIHDSKRLRAWLAGQGGRIELHFLPPYCPEHNRIERLWREVHANVTRNHRCRTMAELMTRLRWYLHREARRRGRAMPQPLKQHQRQAA